MMGLNCIAYIHGCMYLSRLFCPDAQNRMLADPTPPVVDIVTAARRLAAWRPWLLLCSLLWLSACVGEPQAADKESVPVEVDVFTVQSQRVELFSTLPGRTKPYRVAQVRPQVNGVIRKRLFEEGSRVSAGQVLYQLDDQPYAARVEQAQAELDKAKATVEVARQTLERIRDVVEHGAVSRQELDESQAHFHQAKADVALAQASLTAAKIDLDYTRIQSPIEGRIGRSFVTEGALVTANQTGELAQVTQLDPIYVDIPQSSSQLLAMKQALKAGQIRQLKPGQTPVQLVLEDGSLYPQTGRLQFSDVTVDPDTASVTLRARFSNPEHNLLPGMYVQARVGNGVRENALLVPQQGVTRNRQGEATALLADEQDKVVKRVLTIDRAVGHFWLVSEGLAAGERVLLSGHQRVSDGDSVTTVPADVPHRPQTAVQGESVAQDSAAHG